MSSYLQKVCTEEELASELVHVLSANYAIGPTHLLSAIRDRASVNGVAMRTLKIVYPSVLDVGGCFSYTIDHVCECMPTLILSEFSNAWVLLFSHSAKAKTHEGTDWLSDVYLQSYALVEQMGSTTTAYGPVW